METDKKSRKRWDLNNIYKPLFIKINGVYKAVDRDRWFNNDWNWTMYYMAKRVSVKPITTPSPRFKKNLK